MSALMWVPYRIQPGNRDAVTNWFVSDPGADIIARMEQEAGVRYVQTYFSVAIPGRKPPDWDAYDLWEAPDFPSFRKLLDTPAYQEFERVFHQLIIEESDWKVEFLEPAR